MLPFLKSYPREVDHGIVIFVETRKEYVFFHLEQIVGAVRASHVFQSCLATENNLIVTENATTLILEYKPAEFVKHVDLSDVHEIEVVDCVPCGQHDRRGCLIQGQGRALNLVGRQD